MTRYDQLSINTVVLVRDPCFLLLCLFPNFVIVPVDNNEHQRIGDVSTDRISYAIMSLEIMGFAL